MFSSSPPHLVRATELRQDPPPGNPSTVPLPGSEKPGRSRIYRSWHARKALVSTLDPTVTTAHDMFEVSANRSPRAHCLGTRAYDPVKRTFGAYQWLDYQTVQRRRTAFGAGLVQLHEKHGCAKNRSYGVGLWCQNRPEWQITGEFASSISGG